MPGLLVIDGQVGKRSRDLLAGAPPEQLRPRAAAMRQIKRYRVREPGED